MNLPKFTQSLIAVFLMILTGLSSCSKEDNTIGNIPPQLIKTWYMGEYASITFHTNGTGVYTETDEYAARLIQKINTRGTESYSFTYSYQEDSQTLTISLEGESIRWTIASLTDKKLELIDEDGESLSLWDTPNPQTDIDINLLYKTWLSEKNDYYTFRTDGTGSYKKDGADEAQNTTFFYDASSNLLTIQASGETFIWSILTLTYDTMKIIDETGNEITLWSSSGGGGIDIEKLYGTWGYAGTKIMEFKKDTLTFYNIDGASESTKYKYEYNKIFFWIPEGEGSWTESYDLVKTLTQDLLICTKFRENSQGQLEKDMTYSYFRIPQEPESVGDESLLYTGTWTTYAEGIPMTMEFRRNFKDIVFIEDGEKITLDYSYDPEKHIMIVSADGETATWKIVNLTDHILYIDVLNEKGEVDDKMEFRIL